MPGYSFGGYLARGMVYKYSREIGGPPMVCPVVFPGKEERTLPEPVVLERDGSFIYTLGPAEARRFGAMAVIQNERVYRRCRAEISSSYP